MSIRKSRMCFVEYISGGVITPGMVCAVYSITCNPEQLVCSSSTGKVLKTIHLLGFADPTLL